MNFWQCNSHRFEIGARTLVMGIVNTTPDSFSGDGTLCGAASGALPSTWEREQALELSLQHALFQLQSGADILDIGGESTRPGAVPVGEEEEAARVVPLVRALRGHPKSARAVISIDTTKSQVARAALEAGADIINDISGATFDAQMLLVLAPSTCGVILMHLRGSPSSMGWSRKAGGANNVIENDVILDVLAFWRERIRACHAMGIDENRIALDAGFGFGKSVEENLQILRRGRELKIGFPVLSATSRKSTIGKVLGRALQDPRGELPVEERIWGTASTVALAIASGADIVRVHDVREMAHVARMADAVAR